MIRRDGFVTGFSMALGAAVLALFLILGWRFLEAGAAIATPFVIGTVLALLLNPIVGKVQTRYTSGKRGRAVLIVFLSFLAVFIGLVAFLVPAVIGQTGRLVRFFAPLSYRVEQRVPGGSPKVLEADIPGTSYTVGSLRNGTRYTFRVVAVDSEGREYRLRPVTAAPSAREVVAATDKPVVEANPAEDRRSVPTPTPVPPTLRPTSAASPQPVASVTAGNDLPSPRPTVEAHEVALMPRRPTLPSVSASPLPDPSASPAEGEEADDFPSDEFGDTLPTPGEEDPVATPSPQAPTYPLLVPGSPAPSPMTSSAMPVPTPAAPTAEPAATPTAPTTAPAPTPTSGGVAGLLERVGPRERVSQQDSGTSSSAIRLLGSTEPVNVKAGTIVATPGNGKIRLRWRPPANVQSGFDRLRGQVDSWLGEHRKIGFITLPTSIATLQTQYSEQATAWAQGFVRRLASTIIGSLGILITIVLIPLVTFYVLSDMERLRGRLLFFLPTRARIEFVRVSSEVGEVFGNYIRGMATVSAIYGVANFALFLGLGLFFGHGLASYALLLGFIAGILYPVPYIGPTSTTGIAGIIALATGHAPWQAAVIVGAALFVNQLFDNVFVPKLVGKSVGLHPLITLLALLMGGNLFGLAGMLLSVPVAASIQLVLFRLIPRLGAPTPIAYLMPDKKPKESPKSGDSKSSASEQNLIQTPEAMTDDLPSQARANANPDTKTDVTGQEPLGPVPTFRPPTASTSGQPPIPDAEAKPSLETKS